jgi:hypothetical protein
VQITVCLGDKIGAGEQCLKYKIYRVMLEGGRVLGGEHNWVHGNIGRKVLMGMEIPVRGRREVGKVSWKFPVRGRQEMGKM